MAAQTRYAPDLASLDTDAAATEFLYTMAYRNFREDPWPAFSIIGRAFALFRSQTAEVLAILTGTGSFGSIVLAFLIGHRILRRLSVPMWFLRIAGPFGAAFLLCLPIIYLDGGWRVIAASTPFIFTTLSVLLASPSTPAPEPNRRDRFAAWCPAALVAALLILPGVARRLTTPPDTSCASPGIHIVRHPTGEPSVLYENSDASSRGSIPVIDPERVRAQERHSEVPLSLGEPPLLLEWAYDYTSHRLLTLVAPPDLS